MNIGTMIKQLARQGGAGVGFVVGTVSAVDKEARTVDVEPLNEDAPLLGVNLQANQGSTVGVVAIPRVGSYVMVGYVADGAAGMVVLCDDIEEVEVVIKDKDTASIVVTEDGITMNGGSLGGLVKVEDITKRLNLIEKDINKLKQSLSSWTPVPQDGGSALKAGVTSWASQKLAESKRDDYENEKVKQ
jgi:hypothetical protein